MDRRFSFQEITKSEINQKVLNLHSSRACQELDLPTKIIKANYDIFTEVIHKELNRGLEVGNFPCTLKLANVTPVYKKGNRSEKGNYRPVSILPNLLSAYYHYQTYQKSLKDVSTSRYLNFLKE